jgi:hypothetical protein
VLENRSRKAKALLMADGVGGPRAEYKKAGRPQTLLPALTEAPISVRAKSVEYQFDQRHNEREAAVCLICATQDRSPKRRCLGGTPPTPGNVGHDVRLQAGFLAHS